MEKPLIDIREDGFVTIFWDGNRYRRDSDGKSGFRWRRETEQGLTPVGAAVKKLLKWTYKHPGAAKKVHRFPRLPKRTEVTAKRTHIDDLRDIPPTSEFEGQAIRWLVDGIIPESSLVLLCAPPGSYKTWTGLSIGDAVSRGKEFLGRSTCPTTVLYINNDDPLHVIAQRRDILDLREGEQFKIWGRWVGDEPPSIGDERLEEIARLYRPLIVFDPFLHFHSADENSARQMADVMKKLLRIVMAGATVLVIHHGPKSEVFKYRGSSEILAAVDVALVMSVDRKKGEPVITLECFKNRLSEEFTITLQPDFEHGRFEVVTDPAAQKANEMIGKLEDLIRAEPGLRQKDVIAKSKLPKRKVAETLNAGENIHWKITRPGGKTKRYYLMDHATEH
jgi:hypothetical protein